MNLNGFYAVRGSRVRKLSHELFFKYLLVFVIKKKKPFWWHYVTLNHQTRHLSLVLIAVNFAYFIRPMETIRSNNFNQSLLRKDVKTENIFQPKSIITTQDK